MRIRPEKPADAVAIHAVNEAAFESSIEADIVDALRRNLDEYISLVAVTDDQIAGHIFFSPVSLSGNPNVTIMGLGPMAVLPARQRQGIGSALIREGLRQCENRKCSAVVVLGHPEYYPRFGFVPASRYGIGCKYDVPDEVFMLIELERGSLDGLSGQVGYNQAFG